MNISTSFGYHADGVFDSKGEKKLQIAKIVELASKVAAVAVIIFAIVGSVSTGIGIGACFLAFGLHVGYKAYKKYIIGQTAGIIVNNKDLNLKHISSDQFSAQALPTENSSETEIWRKRMIQSAKHNIIVSGNYCGGQSFIDFLDLIEKRYEEVPDLNVVIISSPKFLTEDIYKKVEKLKKDHPNNFKLVESPDIWHIGPGLKKTTNHTKCMVIDYGKYFILGGSGIKDNFVQPGLSNLSKYEYLKNKLSSEEFEKTIEEAKKSKSDGKNKSWLDKFMPGCFRDMDFVFKTSENSKDGLKIFTQSLLLAYRWEQYNKKIEIGNFAKYIPPIKNIRNTGLLSGNSQKILPEDNVITRLFKMKVLKSQDISTKIPEFESSPIKSASKVRIISSGPEHLKSAYNEELKKLLINAKEQITINHMYFHPTDEILELLVSAVKRGVSVKIISCGVFKNCPNSHYIFGPRNKYNYVNFLKKLSPEEKEKVQIFEFQQKKIGNHKKVIVVDDKVLAGSSNLGYKSLVTSSDHEINFIAESKNFADETLKIIEEDIKYSKVFKNNSKLSLKEIFSAYFHRLNAFLIG